jgi:hypothetical protein
MSPASTVVAFLDFGLELPGLLQVDTRRVDTAVQIRRAHLLFEDVERALDAVVDGVEHARPEVHGEGCAGPFDRFTRGDTGRLLVHLDGGSVAFDFDDLAHQPFRTDVDDVVHPGVEVPSRYDRSRDAFDCAVLADVGFCCLTHS